jgi:antitoxin MazE
MINHMAGLVKKLTKYGNCLALIIDRPVLELLGIEIDTPLEISTPDGKNLKITPLRTVSGSQRRGREK